MYFECHITLDAKYKTIAEYTGIKFKAKYSGLKGDEIMGDDLLGYLTFRHDDLYNTMTKMDTIVSYLNNEHNVPIKRKKIEVAIMDFKYE